MMLNIGYKFFFFLTPIVF